jgi:hypothetical protein
LILFLDFDGVLHRHGKTFFEHLLVFEELLRQYPHVQVVFATSWRFGHKFRTDRLALYFSEDIRDRFIGCTPYLQEKWPPYIQHERQKEVLSYMETAGYKGPFVALDDANDLFEDDYEHLIRCDGTVGIDKSIVTKLKAVFEASKP